MARLRAVIEEVEGRNLRLSLTYQARQARP